jgi:3-oxoadipate enol-lactonase
MSAPANEDPGQQYISRSVRVGPAPYISVDVAGEGDLLVFLHGIGGNRLNWADQLPFFARHYCAVAWDARGYGESDDYAEPLDFGDFSEDILRLMAYFGADRAHLVGLSMGGRIALDFYGRYPDRVHSLVLADTSVGSTDAVDPVKIEAFLAKRKQPLLDGKTPAELAPVLVEELMGQHAKPEARQHMIYSLSALHVQSYIKTMDCVTKYRGYPDFDDIHVPSLVIVGQNDRIARPEAAALMAEAIPGAQFHIIEGAGHISNIEAPEEFNQTVLKFLKRIG